MTESAQLPWTFTTRRTTCGRGRQPGWMGGRPRRVGGVAGRGTACGMHRTLLVHDHPFTCVPLKVATGSTAYRKAHQWRAAAPLSPSVSPHSPACYRLSLLNAPTAQVPPRPQR